MGVYTRTGAELMDATTPIAMSSTSTECTVSSTQQSSILIVEDERPIRQMLRALFVGHRYLVTEVVTGQSGVRHTLHFKPDLVILDLGLPDMDGIEVIRQIRKASQVPILVTSARDRTVGGVAALNAGANDYLRKPVQNEELLTRIATLIRLSQWQASDHSHFTTKRLQVDIGQKTVFVDRREVALTPIEFDILNSLVAHGGGIVTLDQLRCELSTAQGTAAEVQLRAVISDLRHKIDGRTIPPTIILTEPGIGYRLGID
jgi:two-component system, OmpR family, KDP operon response regulator KdpE